MQAIVDADSSGLDVMTALSGRQEDRHGNAGLMCRCVCEFPATVAVDTQQQLRVLDVGDQALTLTVT